MGALAGARSGPDGAAARGYASLDASDLARRREEGRVLPGQRRRRRLEGARRDRGLPFVRAVRRWAHVDPISVPAVVGVPGGGARGLTAPPASIWRAVPRKRAVSGRYPRVPMPCGTIDRTQTRRNR